jgi:DNA-binding response OmpR family regulator
MMPKVLIVEDDPSIAMALGDGLAFEGYRVEHAQDGEAALRLLSESRPDLLLLDLMLPKLSGLEVCRRLRREGNPVPIVMLSARAQEIDKVVGLKLGADDYVTKPFGFMELLARVEAVLRRAGSYGARGEVHRFGEVTVDFRRGEAHKGGAALDFTPRELRLLRYFLERRGEVVPREVLLEAVWGYARGGMTRTVDMHVAKLRKKVEDEPADPRWILTVHRVGYKFAE